MEYSGWNIAINTRDTLIDNSQVRVANLAAPTLTSTMLNSAVIQVYFIFNGSVYPLPYTSFAGSKANTISFIPQSKRILITRFAFDDSGTTNLSSSLEYRYVIIPGVVALALKNSHIDMSDYKAVSQFIDAHK